MYLVGFVASFFQVDILWSEDNVSDTFSRTPVSFLDDMGIYVTCRTDLAMSQTFTDAYTVHAVEIQKTSLRVSESMGINVWQTIPVGKAVKIAVHCVGVHRLACAARLLLKEQIIRIMPQITIAANLQKIPFAILPQKFHAFGGQTNISVAFFRFGAFLI